MKKKTHTHTLIFRFSATDTSTLVCSESNLFFCFQVGLTPLHLAAESGHKELVGLLVTNYKASVDALTLVRSCYSLITIPSIFHPF